MRAVLLLLLLLTGWSWAGPVRLTVLSTNDVHGQLRPLPASSFRPILRGKRAGGIAHLATLVGRIRAEERAKGDPVLLLDAGDLFQGTPLGNETRGDAVVDVMNVMRYDAAAVGNHELDFGIDNLLRLARRAEFPLLAANLSLTGREKEPIRPYALFDKPCRIAVLGLVTTRTPQMTSMTIGDQARFADVVATSQRFVREVQADLHFALTHIGVKEDRALARAVPELDLIVSGHSHTPRVLHEADTLIVQTHSRGMSLARVELRLEPGTFEVLSSEGELLEIDPETLPADEAVQTVIARHAEGLDELMAEVVGKLAAPLRRMPGLGSSPAGNWVADVIRSKGEAMVGITNKGGIRCDLEAGPVTRGDLYRLMPFDNTIVAMDLRGSAIRELVERHLESGGYPCLEWSGMRVEAIRDGKRLVPVRIEVAGRLLEDDQDYRVATNSFLAAGGDGFVSFQQGRRAARIGAVLREVLGEALAGQSPLTPPAGPRLVLPGGVR